MSLLHLYKVVAATLRIVHPTRTVVDVEVVDLLWSEQSAEHLAVAQLEILTKEQCRVGVASDASAILCSALLQEARLVGYHLRDEGVCLVRTIPILAHFVPLALFVILFEYSLRLLRHSIVVVVWSHNPQLRLASLLCYASGWRATLYAVVECRHREYAAQTCARLTLDRATLEHGLEMLVGTTTNLVPLSFAQCGQLAVVALLRLPDDVQTLAQRLTLGGEDAKAVRLVECGANLLEARVILLVARAVTTHQREVERLETFGCIRYLSERYRRVC